MARFLPILEYHFSSLNLRIVKHEIHRLFIKNTVKVFIRTAQAFVTEINKILCNIVVCVYS